MINVKEAYRDFSLASSEQPRRVIPQTEVEREARLLLMAFVGICLAIVVSLLAIAALAVVGIGVLVSWLLP
jgi:hypothetical protein